MKSDLESLQNSLLKTLRASGALTQPTVAAAFRAVPRHLFLPGLPLEQVYRDDAIPTKLADGQPISSSSQPAMMAIMLEQLQLAPGQRVLEIGAGTGYNAALIGKLVEPDGHVVTLDIDDDLVEAARRHLAAADTNNVTTVCGDGGLGYLPMAPYDRIILTVGAWDITPAWLAQLKPGGLLVLPLALGAGPQKSMAFRKTGEVGSDEPVLTSLSIRDCGFMRLRGAFAGPETLVALGAEPSLMLGATGGLPVPAEQVLAWLEGDYDDAATGLRVDEQGIWQGVTLWVGLQESQACDLIVTGELARRPPIPGLIVYDSSRPTTLNVGALGVEGLCLLYLGGASRSELFARTFGPEGRAVLEARVLGHLQAWEAAGRPGTQGMRVRVSTLAAPYKPGPGELVVTKRWTKLLIDWPS